VALLVDSLAPLPATVASTQKTQATLVLDGAGPIPARMLHRRRAAIETALHGRRYRAEGELAMVAGHRGRAREDAIAFHFGDGTRRMRRREERAPAVLPVTLVPVHAPPTQGLTVNVSASGALLRGPDEIAQGDELLLHLHLPSEELPIPAKGEVVRRTGDGFLGVRLDRMRDADRALVLRWVAEQPRG
jgi:hypothetical protein